MLVLVLLVFFLYFPGSKQPNSPLFPSMVSSTSVVASTTTVSALTFSKASTTTIPVVETTSLTTMPPEYWLNLRRGVLNSSVNATESGGRSVNTSGSPQTSLQSPLINGFEETTTTVCCGQESGIQPTENNSNSVIYWTGEPFEQVKTAMSLLDSSACFGIQPDILREECDKGVSLLQQAVDSENTSICYSNTEVSGDVIALCLRLFNEAPRSRLSEFSSYEDYKVLSDALVFLDVYYCANISDSVSRQKCVDGVGLIERAVGSGDSSVCGDDSVDVHDLTRHMCRSSFDTRQSGGLI